MNSINYVYDNHADEQTTDGYRLLLQYVSSNVTKTQDDCIGNALHNLDVDAWNAAFHFVISISHHPTAPDMWMLLSNFNTAIIQNSQSNLQCHVLQTVNKTQSLNDTSIVPTLQETCPWLNFISQTSLLLPNDMSTRETDKHLLQAKWFLRPKQCVFFNTHSSISNLISNKIFSHLTSKTFQRYCNATLLLWTTIPNSRTAMKLFLSYAACAVSATSRYSPFFSSFSCWHVNSMAYKLHQFWQSLLHIFDPQHLPRVEWSAMFLSRCCHRSDEHSLLLFQPFPTFHSTWPSDLSPFWHARRRQSNYNEGCNPSLHQHESEHSYHLPHWFFAIDL